MAPALRSRSVEVRLQAKSLQNKHYRDSYKIAVKNRGALFRMARALVTVALGTSPSQIKAIMESKADLITPEMADRPRWSTQCVLTGLHMLIHTMTEFEVEGVEEVKRLEAELITYMGGRVTEVETGKSASEVDRVLSSLNIMADETFDERSRLFPGKHYWRQGESVYLVLQSCLPRYHTYCKGIGEVPVFKQFNQLIQLLEGEVYFERMEPHPENPEIQVYVVNAKKLADKGTTMNNFRRDTEAAGQ